MTEEKKASQPSKPLTEEKGLPPVEYSPPTPPVKPPKKK